MTKNDDNCRQPLAEADRSSALNEYDRYLQTSPPPTRRRRSRMVATASKNIFLI